MNYTIIAVKVDSREDSAAKVQAVLTKYGCAIKVRLGLHDLPGNSCTSCGLIILEVDGPDVPALESALAEIDGVTSKKVEL